MKKLIFTAAILYAVSTNAQDCMTPPSVLSKYITKCLQQNDKACLKAQYLTWQMLEPVYDSVLTKMKNDYPPGKVSDLPTKEDAQKEIEEKLSKELNDNIDSLFDRIQRFGAKFQQAVYSKEKINITSEDDMPAGFYSSDGSFRLNCGDSIYRFSYTYLFLNGQWKIARLNNSFDVYSKSGEHLGIMAETFERYDEKMMDSAMVAPTVDTLVSPVKSKPTGKKTPAKKTTAKPKQAIRKPGQQ